MGEVVERLFRVGEAGGVGPHVDGPAGVLDGGAAYGRCVMDDEWQLRLGNWICAWSLECSGDRQLGR